MFSWVVDVGTLHCSVSSEYYTSWQHLRILRMGMHELRIAYWRCSVTNIWLNVITGCLKTTTTTTSKRPLLRLQTSYQSKCYIFEKYTLSYPMPKKSFKYNTYFRSYGQNDISTGFLFWQQHYMFILKLIEFIQWVKKTRNTNQPWARI